MKSSTFARPSPPVPGGLTTIHDLPSPRGLSEFTRTEIGIQHFQSLFSKGRYGHDHWARDTVTGLQALYSMELGGIRHDGKIE